VDPIVTALEEQQAELATIMDRMTEIEWRAPTRCEGWTTSDVVLHLAQSDEMAVASASGRFPRSGGDGTTDWNGTQSVDEGVARMVERERGIGIVDLRERWTSTARELVRVLDHMDLSTRVPWVAGDLSARTLATTRMAETWIHAGDVGDAIGVALEQTGRLRLVARLAWRTLPYAFASAGRTMAGPIAFRLTSPGGEPWDFLPEEPATTTITGPAADLCAVAARRADPSATSLHGEGPDAANVLALVRTYA